MAVKACCVWLAIVNMAVPESGRLLHSYCDGIPCLHSTCTCPRLYRAMCSAPLELVRISPTDFCHTAHLLGRWLSSRALKSRYRSASGPAKMSPAVCRVSLRPVIPAFMSLIACRKVLKASLDSLARALHACEEMNCRIRTGRQDVSLISYPENLSDKDIILGLEVSLRRWRRIRASAEHVTHAWHGKSGQLPAPSEELPPFTPVFCLWSLLSWKTAC